MILTGAIIITLWGIGHLVPTKGVVKGFGELSRDNKLTITMEWLAEGMALIFLGLLPLTLHLSGFAYTVAGNITIQLCAAMLIALSILSLFTGARTSVIPMKICPAVKTVVAILYYLG